MTRQRKLYALPVAPGSYRQVLSALINLVAAEDQFVRDTHMKLNDTISAAVEDARAAIAAATKR